MFDPAPEDGFFSLGEGAGVIGEDFFPKTGLLRAVVGGDGGDAGGAVESEAAFCGFFAVASEAFA